MPNTWLDYFKQIQIQNIKQINMGHFFSQSGQMENV